MLSVFLVLGFMKGARWAAEKKVKWEKIKMLGGDC